MSMIASSISPITFPPQKVLVFWRVAGQEPILFATGSVLDPNPLKITLKRILLTGYPMRTHKKKAVVRFMFFNPEDIHYFKPVELYTKFGRRGKIKESLGTHGLMKCFFNDHMTQADTVCLPLYKWVIPIWYEEGWTQNVNEDPNFTFETQKPEEVNMVED